ncbi:MAG TPA: hypothetical protein VM243_12930 [Phycisphaerae bacterium]|nr:hypothetical protein [Phycisphaerae bacterium]
MSVAPNYGLAEAGIQNRTTDADAVQQVDVMRGWQSLRVLTDGADDGGNGADILTDMNDAPSDAVELPVEGRNIMIRALSETAGGVVADIYLYPPDPASGNKTDGNAAGWIEIDGATFTTATSQTMDGIGAVQADCKVSPYVVIDRKGAKYMATRIGTIQGTTHTEMVYRVF